MSEFRRTSAARRQRPRGQGALQYGLGLALITVVAIVGAGAVGRTTVSSTCQVAEGLSGSGCDAAGNLLSLPGIPATAATATAGFRQATVAFSPATLDGGAPILRYEVVSTPGNITASGPSSPITVTGLAPGGVYTFTVRAVNSVGAGVPSASSKAVTLANVPGAPSGVIALGTADASVGVTFYVPASNGGTPITSFMAISTPGALTASGSASPITVTGLDVATFYTFSVVAINAVGIGSPSTASAQVKPVPPPAIPTGLAGVGGNNVVTMTWAATPGADSYAYMVSSSCQSMTGSAGNTLRFADSAVANGSPQTFSIRSHGPGGYSAYSQTGTATPTGPPGAPSGASAVAATGQAAVSFVAPYNCGGTPITSYTVTSTPGGLSTTGTAPPLTVTGLTAGTPYTFRVVATSVIGTSTSSSSSQPVTPS